MSQTTDASYHAENRFTDRINSDVSLLQSCWHDGTPIRAPNREYERARVYEGPLCDDVVMLADESNTHG